MNKILTVIVITIFGMLGGQGYKWIRRYLIPSLASLYNATSKKKNKLKSFVYLILMPILSMGYGENSKLKKLCFGSDTATRIVYGLLLSIPFWFFNKGYASLVLPLAFSIRAGRIPITKTKDFLFEDLIRYSTLGTLIVL